MYDRLKKDIWVLELDFGNNPDKLSGEYLDMYEGVKSEVLSTTWFHENSDLSMTYLGRIDMIRESKIKAEEKFPISRTRVYCKKITRWHRMSDTFRHRSKQVIYAQVTLAKIQTFTSVNKICIQISKNPSRKWTIH